MIKRLHLKIRQLDDGRFYLRFWWHWWENTHEEIYGSKEDLEAGIETMIDGTWKEGESKKDC